PGRYAAADARRALRAGLHVMLFSDNVPVEQEIELKRLARERGLMLMGPDCGTAIVNGVPLGFANVVSRGRIGIAAASGTGAQEVMSTIARCGEGVSHVIGVGGRDLSDAVGGLAMEQAIDALAADPATSVVCVIGKPPGVTGTGGGHRVVDLGEDVFTVGRPHPMIDGTVRREWIAREAADPSTAALLLDIVLGHGAHPDPAGELLPAIDAARDQASRRG